MASEELLHHIWKRGLFRKKNLKTTCGKELMILQTGVHNSHEGPDFFNARIRVNRLEWAGNVEIHLASSDWIKHGHHTDPGYNNVILHVVGKHDKEVMNSQGRKILTLVMDFPESVAAGYRSLRDEDSWLACCRYIQRLPAIRLERWLKQLQDERSHIKSNRIGGILRYYNNGWENTLYLAMASGFGLPVNCLPFEIVASRIPLEILMQNRESLTDLEALLFGQAGFLQTGVPCEPYPEKLLRIYNFKQGLFTGGPLPRHLWKFLRLRPVSFPTLRLSQFSALIHLRSPIMDKVVASTSMTELEQLLQTRASEYWNTHYLFGKCSPESIKQLGIQSIRTIIINVIVPFLQAYGKIEHHMSLVNRATEILKELDSEKNIIIRKWVTFGIRTSNAYESQALIQLYNNYCIQNRCMDCQIGASIIESSVNEKQ